MSEKGKITGEDLRHKLKATGMDLADIAAKMPEPQSRQWLNSKLKANDFGINFLSDLATACGKEISFLLGEEAPLTVVKEDPIAYGSKSLAIQLAECRGEVSKLKDTIIALKDDKIEYLQQQHTRKTS